MEVEQAVATFIDRVNDLLAVLNAERGNRLTRTEYLRWMVPISQAWEVIFDHASQVPDTDLDSLVSGTETDRNRALQLLHQIVCNELPMAALAGEVSMVVLPRYNEQELSSIFIDIIERMQVVAKLLRSDSAAVDWSHYRTTADWLELRHRANLSPSERTWTRKRSEHSGDIQDEPGSNGRSCRMTQKLADQWGLKLPEFE